MVSGKQKKQMESSLNERELLLTFRAHLHLINVFDWIESVWKAMVGYYENRAGSPATLSSLQQAFAKYNDEYKVTTMLVHYGIHFDPILNMLVGDDSCWIQAETDMPSYQETIRYMKERVFVNYYLLEAIFSSYYLRAASFSAFCKKVYDPRASSFNARALQSHEVKIGNLSKKDVEEMKAKLSHINVRFDQLTSRHSSIVSEVLAVRDQLKDLKMMKRSLLR
ncbi:uncharacterized protein LOC133311922 isoform X2 [Gastrolobium bilobum]|uniref:uncharacterized protein LOC133311922 isoform X2 n=1 Tax=Gastrolobium bilobum TaxID=150636 RepID=UPI002AB007FB|nr:uncharacterized protein LOC133311922 isoform X2 [Gastrolobium bilobum]